LDYNAVATAGALAIASPLRFGTSALHQMDEQRQSYETPTFREIAPALEFACWVVVGLAPFLRWVNGAAVTRDQFVIQIALTSSALAGALSLRFYNYRASRGTCKLGSVPSGVAHDAPEGAEPVAKADLLAGAAIARLIPDGDFGDTPTAACNLGRNLRLDAEAFLTQDEAFRNLAAHHLITRLHIGKTEAGQAIRAPCQKPVGSPLQARADWRRTAESTAIDDVGLILRDNRNEPRKVCRIVFQVGVLNNDDVALHVGEGRPNSRPFATIPGVDEDPNVGQSG
jgi:hypothetical protein